MTEPAADATYAVYAVKHAERDARRPERFLGGDPRDAPMPMDYFVASTPDAIVPGHDPRVLERYPSARPGLERIAARLDLGRGELYADVSRGGGLVG